MAKPKTIRPSYYDDDQSSEDELSYALSRKQGADDDNDDDDELQSISFGALNKAQQKIRSSSTRNSKSTSSHNQHDSDSENELFFESDSDSDGPPQESSSSKNSSKKRSKHAPTEASSKRPVSRIRQIPGLESTKTSSLYTDIRFDAAYGKADLAKARRDYAFLDEYRQQEIKRMEEILRDKKLGNYLSEQELDEIRMDLQSLKSRMDTLKNRDLENKILSEFKQKQLENFKVGKQNNPYFLKRSEKRKILQKAKFDSMKPKQREKVMERKRKKRLGKEFKQLEFKPRN